MLDDRALREIAAQQWGYFTSRQAAGLRFHKVLQHYHVKHGGWQKVTRGLYRLPGYADTPAAEFTRWTLWAQGQSNHRVAAVSHASALHYHGLSQVRPEWVEITVSALKHNPHDVNCRLHLDTLAAEDSVLSEGFRITTPLRTLRDMKPDLSYAGRWTDTVRLDRQRSLITEEEAQGLLGAIGAIPASHPVFALPEGNKPALANVSGTTPWQPHRGGTAMPTPPRRRFAPLLVTGRQGFTLVELLVVVSIVAILAALLLPSLQKSMHSARTIACRSTIRQIGIAAGMYTSDSNGWLLPNNWCGKIFPYGFAYPMLRCPLEMRAAVNIDTVSYGINIDNITGLAPTWWGTPKTRLSSIEGRKRTATTVYLMDGTGYYVQHVPPFANQLNWGKERHGGWVNVLWVDLHSTYTHSMRLADSDLSGGEDRGYFYWDTTSRPPILH